MGRILRILGIGAILVVVAAGVLALTGKKTFRTEIVIAAPPAAVWAVLTNAEGYAAWNPVFVRVAGTFGPGATMRSQVKTPGGQTLNITGKVVTFLPGKVLRQQGGTTGLLTFDHRWLLEPVAGGTRVVQHEVDRGLFLWFWDSSWIVPSYRRVNQALRKRVLEMQGRAK